MNDDFPQFEIAEFRLLVSAVHSSGPLCRPVWRGLQVRRIDVQTYISAHLRISAYLWPTDFGVCSRGQPGGHSVRARPVCWKRYTRAGRNS